MAPRVPDPLPKPGTSSFRAEWERVLGVLDLPRLMVVIEGALDRNSLEDAFKKAFKGRAVRPNTLGRPQLVAMLTEASRLNPDVAFQVMQRLDKSCHRERNIVASMDAADQAFESRIATYKAIDLRRERARLVWALVRDGRDAAVVAGSRILDETFAAVAEAEEVKDAVVHGESTGVRHKLEHIEKAVKEQGELLQREQRERERAEADRSDLVVKLGQKERALKVEEGQRRELEHELATLKKTVADLERAREASGEETVAALVEERDRWREKARALERRVEHIAEVEALKARIAELESENATLRAEGDRRRDEQSTLLRQLASRERAAQARADSLRESLKKARQLAVSGPVDETPTHEERVGIFVDAANLRASARREHGGRFDFIGMLGELVGDRRRALAVAFVVDAGEPGAEEGFRGFVRALQAGGYEVREKRTRVRADGTRKADWDMGIAMEILDARNRVDTVVLCSGDGDFLPLVRRLKRWGKRVEIASFSASSDPELVRNADTHHALDGRFAIAT